MIFATIYQQNCQIEFNLHVCNFSGRKCFSGAFWYAYEYTSTNHETDLNICNIMLFFTWFHYMMQMYTTLCKCICTMCMISSKGKGKGICLESRYPRYTCSSDFTFPLAVGTYGSLQLSIQPWICAPGTHYGWVDRGSVVYKVCPTLLHMASTGNRTLDLLILSPTPYPLGHMLMHMQ